MRGGNVIMRKKYDRDNTTWEDVRILHELVKNHPYRECGDKKWLDSYKDTLYELVDAFYYAFYKTMREKYSVSYFMPSFGHDFNAAISGIGYSNAIDKENHVERCIGCVHRILESGGEPLPLYQLTRTVSGGTVYRKFEWDSMSKNYYPIYEKEELDKMIAEYNEVIGDSIMEKCVSHWKYREHLLDIKSKYYDKYL